ncbi:MAG: 4Fe-4S cluster-binding domain-containing protein [Acutalibacteraceae bacterium]
MKGIITEIERFALKDGPGIRTTVFFKGCNMACKWCHNPETLSVRPQLMIYPDKCIGCGACVWRPAGREPEPSAKTVPCSTIAPPASTAEPAPRTASPVLSSCPERR